MRLLALVLLLCAAPALAQLRHIPAEAKRGQIRHVQGMVVEINGREQRLSPGAQIRDASNFIIVPTALPEGSIVKYLLDANEMVQRVWVLTPQEAAQQDRR
jgi:hypothetical protein